MPKKQLSEFEKGQAVAWSQSNISKKEIAKRLNRSPNCIRKLLKKYNATGTSSRKFGSGRKRKTSSQDDRQIIRLLQKNRFITSKSILKELPLNISHSTIKNRLKEVGFYGRVAVKKPFISERNIAARLKWAKLHLNWTAEKWKTVLWSDETSITLNWKGRNLVWRKVNERYNKNCMVGTVKHDKKINIWGCFAANGVGHFVEIKGILDATKYKQLLIHHAKPSAMQLFGKNNNYIFQHDNDPKHTAKIVTNYLSNKKWETMDWPAQSPDLNPIENLWADIKRRTKDRKPQNEKELFEIMKKAWLETEKSYLLNLISSMPRRCKAVLESKGLPIKY